MIAAVPGSFRLPTSNRPGSTDLLTRGLVRPNQHRGRRLAPQRIRKSRWSLQELRRRRLLDPFGARAQGSGEGASRSELLRRRGRRRSRLGARVRLRSRAALEASSTEASLFACSRVRDEPSEGFAGARARSLRLAVERVLVEARTVRLRDIDLVAREGGLLVAARVAAAAVPVAVPARHGLEPDELTFTALTLRGRADRFLVDSGPVRVRKARVKALRRGPGGEGGKGFGGGGPDREPGITAAGLKVKIGEVARASLLGQREIGNDVRATVGLERYGGAGAWLSVCSTIERDLQLVALVGDRGGRGISARASEQGGPFDESRTAGAYARQSAGAGISGVSVRVRKDLPLRSSSHHAPASRSGRVRPPIAPTRPRGTHACGSGSANVHPYADLTKLSKSADGIV